MHDNKVLDKVIWEGSITPDEETSFSQSNIPNQPQMMFCYKCNNVIPADSKFCPCCNVELYTACPNCGVKYSSQYTICNQCGINREEYLRVQRKERERKEAIERENRRRQENLEREKQERERQEALDRQRYEDDCRKKREAYERQTELIINTKEYQSTNSILKESIESWREKHINIIVLSIIIGSAIIVALGAIMDKELLSLIGLPIGLGVGTGIVIPITRMLDVEKRNEYILQYISRKGSYYDKDILDYVVKKMGDSFYKYTYDVLENLSKWCIEAYRESKGLTS